MLWHRWLHPNSVDRSVCQVFTLLQYSIPGANPTHQKNHTYHQMFPAHFSGNNLDNVLVSPSGRITRYSEHSMRFRHFCRESRPLKIRARPNGVFGIMKSADRMECLASWNPHNGTSNDANQHTPHFFPRTMQWSGSESSLSPNKGLFCSSWYACLRAGWWLKWA
jgi:hypothetical protein